MKIKLFIRSWIEGIRHSGVFEIQQDHCLIGRKRADLLLADPACSRQHALLYTDGNGDLRLKDLESTNGTFCRGEPVEDLRLRVGDEFRIGDTRMVVLDFKPRPAMENALPPPRRLPLPDLDEDETPEANLVTEPRSQLALPAGERAGDGAVARAQRCAPGVRTEQTAATRVVGISKRHQSGPRP